MKPTGSHRSCATDCGPLLLRYAFVSFINIQLGYGIKMAEKRYVVGGHDGWLNVKREPSGLVVAIPEFFAG